MNYQNNKMKKLIKEIKKGNKNNKDEKYLDDAMVIATSNYFLKRNESKYLELYNKVKLLIKFLIKNKSHHKINQEKKMKINSYYNESGKSLQEVISEVLIIQYNREMVKVI